MTDGPDRTRGEPRSGTGRPVETLASQALTFLARHRFAGSGVVSERQVTKLQAAVLAQNPEQRDRVVSDMREDGVSLEEIIDLYIPAVARNLGEQWCSDGLGFADVTIASARLQGLVRDLAEEVAPIGPRTAGVAVVVLSDEYHTLGALILATQLRRLGISVRLMIGLGSGQALSELQASRYDAVLISASHSESLAKLAKFVKNLRKQTERNMPVVIGGPIVELATDVQVATGADAVTSDLEEALRACRLKISRDGARKHMMSGQATAQSHSQTSLRKT